MRKKRGRKAKDKHKDKHKDKEVIAVADADHDQDVKQDEEQEQDEDEMQVKDTDKDKDQRDDEPTDVGADVHAADDEEKQGKEQAEESNEIEEITGELCAVTSAEGVIELPPEFFQLNALSDILNLETWHTYLDERDRAYLRLYLPREFDESPGGELEKVFQPRENINFGNPCASFMRDIKAGQCHPKVIKYKSIVADMQYSSFFHRIRSYHNNMVFNFLERKEMAEEEKENKNRNPLDIDVNVDIEASKKQKLVS